MLRALLRRLRRRPEPIRFDGDDGNVVELPNGTKLRNVHEASACSGRACCIHNPSERAKAIGRLHWCDDRRLMERICMHGYGHPDPDALAYEASIGGGRQGRDIHRCDGCCRPTAG